MEEQERKDWCETTIANLEKEIEKVNEEGINNENITYLGKVIDAHKDLKNEYYWKEKIDMYGTYGRYDDSYGRQGVRGTGPYSRYSDGESYGRRGVPGTGRGRYRGHDMIDDMYNAYSDYMDHGNYGNYGTSESMQKIAIMGDSLIDFVEHIMKEAKTPEEKHLIHEKIQELSRM